MIDTRVFLFPFAIVLAGKLIVLQVDSIPVSGKGLPLGVLVVWDIEWLVEGWALEVKGLTQLSQAVSFPLFSLCLLKDLY